MLVNNCSLLLSAKFNYPASICKGKVIASVVVLNTKLSRLRYLGVIVSVKYRGNADNG